MASGSCLQRHAKFGLNCLEMLHPILVLICVGEDEIERLNKLGHMNLLRAKGEKDSSGGPYMMPPRRMNCGGRQIGARRAAFICENKYPEI